MCYLYILTKRIYIPSRIQHIYENEKEYGEEKVCYNTVAYSKIRSIKHF